MSDVLSRFHRTLVDEIRDQRPEYLTGPFTVAEIYQNLVPYGTHRDRIGVEMNGDYEDALLRLLAGEGDYLVLESAPALRDLRDELDSPNPNTGVYREFAAVDVRLNQARLDADRPGATFAGPPRSEDEGDEAAAEAISVMDLAPADPGPAMSGPGYGGEATPGTDVHGRTSAAEGASRAGSNEPGGRLESPPGEPDAAAPPRTSDDGAACRWCRAELPPRGNLNFCPFCGTDVHVVPCPSCGEELDPDWRFCISCGTEVGE